MVWRVTLIRWGELVGALDAGKIRGGGWNNNREDVGGGLHNIAEEAGASRWKLGRHSRSAANSGTLARVREVKRYLEELLWRRIGTCRIWHPCAANRQELTSHESVTGSEPQLLLRQKTEEGKKGKSPEGGRHGWPKSDWLKLGMSRGG